MSRREKLFWLCAGAGLIVLVFSVVPSHYEICEVAEKTKEEHCTRYQFVPFVGIKIAQILDKGGAAITALATIAIAAFTFTLKAATDRLWDAGERQLELLSKTSADQSRDMRASVAAAEAAVSVAQNTAQRQLRAYVSVGGIARTKDPGDLDGVGFAVLVEVKNDGQTPAYDLVQWAKIEVREFPLTGGMGIHCLENPGFGIVPPHTKTMSRPSSAI